MQDRRARLIAFYLPQFYPTPENNEWWGPGFTEWTNVARATPLFRGHRQPRIPADLGFYDLRVPEVRAAQADLARGHGIEAFCYWHYWFTGEQLLDRPFAEVLASGEPDFPFCLGWANHDWTTNWFGGGEVLKELRYSVDDDVRHAHWLSRAFADDRYVRVSGRPLFLVYRPRALPEPERTTDTLRDVAVRAGLPEPYLLGIDGYCFGRDCRSFGFDGTVSWEPQFRLLPGYLTSGPRLSKLARDLRLGVVSALLKLYDYRRFRELHVRRRQQFSHPYFPTVLVAWDNTPRRGREGIVVVNDDPEYLEEALSATIGEVGTRPFEERLVFVNAWNEWAEGNYLEPDRAEGTARLQAVQRAVAEPLPSRPDATAPPPAAAEPTRSL